MPGGPQNALQSRCGGVRVKARAWVDLPAAVDAVLAGRQFLSSVLSEQARTVSRA
jgi:hypothetical protein